MSLRSRLANRGSDDGFLTVLLACGVLVVLLGFGAFAVDVSQAYTVRRQLSSAADSASLASATAVARTYGLLNGVPQSCASMQSAGAGLAQSTANTYTGLNHPTDTAGAPSVTATISCPAAGTALDVTATNNASVPSVFGGVLGVGHLQPTQTATAEVSVATTVSGLRPYALCINDQSVANMLNDSNQSTESWHVIQFAFAGSTSACQPTSGDWFLLDCPGEGGSTPDLVNATKNGCKNPVTAIGSTSSTFLYNKCNVANPPAASCLGADTGGNLSDSQVVSAWDGLVGQVILLPIIYEQTPSCPPRSIGQPYGATNCGGTPATYPVASFVGVEVCGFHWDNKFYGTYTMNSPSSDPCHRSGTGADGNFYPSANSTPDLAGVSPASADNYLLLAFSVFLQSGTTGPSGPGNCSLSDKSCNHGVFVVRLVK